MKLRERVLSLLSGQTPDRVPWLADLDYWANAMQRRGEVSAGFIGSPAYFDLNRQLGTGFYLQGYFPFKALHDDTVRIVTRQDGDRRWFTYETPAGAITSVWQYLPDSFSEAPIEHFVKRPADLAALRHVYEHVAYAPDYADIARRQALIGDNGVVLCYLPRSPFMQMAAEMVGIETIVALWSEAPDELAETLRVMERSHDRAAAIAVDSPAECLMIPENLSSEVVGKRFFERHLRGYETKWVERIRQVGKYSFIHMDGTLRGLLREVASVGFDVIEAVTPAPVGDLTLEEMRRLAGPAQILWGGVPGVYFTDLVDDAEFDRFARDALAAMAREPRYVLGVADQVPPNALRRRVARVAELVEMYPYLTQHAN
jgi:uroporphyrinogen-III decarboxylase